MNSFGLSIVRRFPGGFRSLSTSSPLILRTTLWQNTHRTFASENSKKNSTDANTQPEQIRISKLLSQYATNLTISRNAADKLIQQGEVTIAGEIVRSSQMAIRWKDLQKSGSVLIKVQGKGIRFDIVKQEGRPSQKPVVYAVHKLAGEVVTENDPQNRPSMMKRLVQGGVGRKGVGKAKQHQLHLKPIGRLDMPTEGLILVTNDGDFARSMELPKNRLHRVYRARVHGRLTSVKLNRIRAGGVQYEGTRYGPMKVALESGGRRNSNQSSTNTWVQITTTEGKNRQIRNVFKALGSKSNSSVCYLLCNWWSTCSIFFH